MESRSSLRQLHQQLGDFSLSSPMTIRPSENHLSWHLDQRIPPPLPSLPQWAANSNQTNENRRHSRDENTGIDGLMPVVPPEGWRKPRPYFMAMKQLPTKVLDTDENQQYQENNESGDEEPQQSTVNQAEPEQMESYDIHPSTFTKKLKSLRAELRSSIDSAMKFHEDDEIKDDDDLTSSGSGSETNQQEDRSLQKRSLIRGQFFRSWKKNPKFQEADNNYDGGWPPASNKWKDRAIMDPFVKRRLRTTSIQPPLRAQPPSDQKIELPKAQIPPDRVRELPKVHSPPNHPNELKSGSPPPGMPSIPSVSSSPRPKNEEHAVLNPLRLSSADKRRAAGLHRSVTPVSPPSPPSLPIHSARGQMSRNTSRDSLPCSNDRLSESEEKQEPVEFPRLDRQRIKKLSQTRNASKQPKKSTMDVLNEIKRKREARRAQQVEEKRRLEKELREHGDDAGYKFRRLIQQYREELPPNQQQQQLQQLPPLSLSTSVQPPPTPTVVVDAAEAPRLSVFIRKRPLAKKELKAKGYDIITCLFASEGQDNNLMLVRRELVCHEPKLRVDCSETLENHQFRFDGVFDEWQENSKVYNATVGPMVPYLVSKATSSSDTTSLTVFAYGQTGSGKTYTMKSIYRQAAVDLFLHLDEMKERSNHRNSRVSVGVSFYEIYMNSVNDLLNGRARVQLMEDGDGAVQLPGLKELPATNADELLALVHLGEQARATSANAVHDDSSRSHALLRVTLYDKNGPELARFSMVDLAGSERASDTQSDKKSTRMEGAEINKSLLALKECIRALDRGATHIPFRQSKLTQLLRDSFLSQNSKTIMIATVSPCSENSNHTLNTLRYADRLKEIGASN